MSRLADTHDDAAFVKGDPLDREVADWIIPIKPDYMGHYMGEDIAACERVGITPYVARPQRGTAVGDGRFPKERFRYDEVSDFYHCPAEQRLDTRYRWLQGGHIIVQYSNPRACGGC